MTITIKQELRLYIDPLTEQEYALLEKSLLSEGCRDALVLWGDVLIDGHNRYEICSKHNLPYKTIQNDSFESIEEVMLWMIDNQLSRRSVTDFQRGMLALRKKELIEAQLRVDAPLADTGSVSTSGAAANESGDAPPVEVKPKPAVQRQEVAKIAGVSSHTIGQIEKIQKTASPQLINAVRAGSISISAAAAVASLPEEEQIAAVAAGRKELQQVAKRIREQKQAEKPRKPKQQSGPTANAEPGSPPFAVDSVSDPHQEIARLHAQIAQLQAENARLRTELERLNAVSV